MIIKQTLDPIVPISLSDRIFFNDLGELTIVLDDDIYEEFIEGDEND